jgi:hypothetical protein
MDTNAAITALRDYIRAEYHGDMVEALESIGALKRIRAILGLPELATTDPKFYWLEEQ